MASISAASPPLPPNRGPPEPPLNVTVPQSDEYCSVCGRKKNAVDDKFKHGGWKKECKFCRDKRRPKVRTMPVFGYHRIVYTNFLFSERLVRLPICPELLQGPQFLPLMLWDWKLLRRGRLPISGENIGRKGVLVLSPLRRPAYQRWSSIWHPFRPQSWTERATVPLPIPLWLHL